MERNPIAVAKICQKINNGVQVINFEIKHTIFVLCKIISVNIPKVYVGRREI